MLYYHLDYLYDHNLFTTEVLGKFHIVTKTKEKLEEIKSFFDIEELSSDGGYPDIYIEKPYEIEGIYDSQFGYVYHFVISTFEHRFVVKNTLEFLEAKEIILDDELTGKTGYLETEANEIITYLYEDIFNNYRTVKNVIKCLGNSLFTCEEKNICFDSRYGIKEQTIIRPTSEKSKKLIEMILNEHDWKKLI